MAQPISPTWPGWTLGQALGQGTFGTVYEIHRDVFGHREQAALKVISIPQSQSDIDELLSDGYDRSSITLRFESYLKDIVREYSLMSDLKGSSHIVHCDDLRYIQHDDGMGWDIYIKMELLTPLPQALSSTISEATAIRLGMDICRALILCRSRNLIHRDIKPQNIFVAQDGTYKLGDFGIAKTAEKTSAGTKAGTYKYMAPEVYLGRPYGAGADIYSLGLVLYWLMNRRRTPFLPLPPQVPTATQEEQARAQRFAGQRLPPPACGSPRLQQIILKACAFDPAQRYQRPEEMLRDLEVLLQQQSRPIPREEPTVQARPAPAEPTVKTAVAPAPQPAPAKPPETPKPAPGPTPAPPKSAPVPEKTKKKKVPMWLRVLLIAAGGLGLACIVTAIAMYGPSLSHEHNWLPATCDSPSVCAGCGETQGEPLGGEHQPVYYANTTLCSRCGTLAYLGPDQTVAVGLWHTAALRTDGTVATAGKNDKGQCDVSSWTDMVSVAAAWNYTLGLRSDGTAMVTGQSRSSVIDVSDWTGIIAISANTSHALGLKEDRTVVCSGDNSSGQCNVSGWTGIIAIAAGDDFSAGMKADGTVVVASTNDNYDVSDWNNMVSIAAGNRHLVGLRADGTVVATGNNYDGQCDTQSWTGVVSVFAGTNRTFGILADGTLLALGNNDNGELNIAAWPDVQAVASNTGCTAAITLDGTLVEAGNRSTAPRYDNNGAAPEDLTGLGQSRIAILKEAPDWVSNEPE